MHRKINPILELLNTDLLQSAQKLFKTKETIKQFCRTCFSLQKAFIFVLQAREHFTKQSLKQMVLTLWCAWIVLISTKSATFCGCMSCICADTRGKTANSWSVTTKKQSYTILVNKDYSSALLRIVHSFPFSRPPKHKTKNWYNGAKECPFIWHEAQQFPPWASTVVI